MNFEKEFASVEGAAHVDFVKFKNIFPRPSWERVRVRGKKVAFTLAEVMIVVVVIGVVAAITLPPLIRNFAERINSNRQANIVQKMTKAVELMAVNGDYRDIYSTEEFINKLSKYLKIVKVCDSEHVADCWPTKKIKTANGDSYDVSNAKTRSDLYVGGDIESNNVGLVLADGASLILTYNPKTAEISTEGGFISSTKSLPIGSGKFKDFSYSSNATVAIDFVMDVNGGAGPNREVDTNGNFYDIRSFKVATFTPEACPGTRVKVKSGTSYCLVELGMSYDPYNCSTKPRGGASYCSHFGASSLSNNYLAGAYFACADMGKRIPSSSELLSFKNLNLSGWNFDQYITTDAISSSLWGSGYIPRVGGTGYKGVLPYEQAPVLCIKNL